MAAAEQHGITQLRAYHVQQAWQTARKKAGYPEARLHDLRHASLTLNAQLGATTAELMRRAGHASARAAQHYQRAAESRDKDLAALLSALDRPQGHTEGKGMMIGLQDGNAGGRG